jgi:predicted HAD superfamily Cof-like phosphohydrolase
MTLISINQWQKLARPEPTSKDLNIAIAVHIEEILEMFEEIQFENELASQGAEDMEFYQELKGMMELIKDGTVNVRILHRGPFLDALADQVVTAVGVGHCAGMDVPQACDIVDTSNYSKFKDGKPLFNDQGKIIKNPATYQKPDLIGLY